MQGLGTVSIRDVFVCVCVFYFKQCSTWGNLTLMSKMEVTYGHRVVPYDNVAASNPWF